MEQFKQQLLEFLAFYADGLVESILNIDLDIDDIDNIDELGISFQLQDDCCTTVTLDIKVNGLVERHTSEADYSITQLTGYIEKCTAQGIADGVSTFIQQYQAEHEPEVE